MQTTIATEQTSKGNGKGKGKATEQAVKGPSDAAVLADAGKAAHAAALAGASTVEGPQADPAAAGKAAFAAEYVACQSPTFYVSVGRSMARTQARKAAKSAILALLK